MGGISGENLEIGDRTTHWPPRYERGEVRVLRENLLRRDVLLELHQPAPLGDERVQRIESFGAVQLARIQVRLAQRGDAGIDEGSRQRRRAESATGRVRIVWHEACLSNYSPTPGTSPELRCSVWRPSDRLDILVRRPV